MPRIKWHYHVIENTPGYMPDADPAMFTTKRDAQAYAASLARELREDGYHCWGSASSGSISCERNSDDLGRVIEINACDDAACLDQ